jgi:hypothetical protein
MLENEPAHGAQTCPLSAITKPFSLSPKSVCRGRNHVVLLQSSSRPFLMQDETDEVGAAVHLRPRSPMAPLAEAGVR